MSSRSWLRCRPLSRLRRPAARSRARLVVESLEERAVPATAISISDATAVEGNGAMKFIDSFMPAGSGGLIYARGIDYGPDGNLYVSGETIPPGPSRGFVNRYDATTGAFIDTFASDPTMTGAKDVEFGPDGNLYVPNNNGSNIYRFNGMSGAFMDVFVPTGSGGLNIPRSVTFGPDGNGDGNRDLYVTSAGTNNVLRYDGVTGAFLNAFVPSGSGGLTDPTALVFGPDGNLYVASGAHTNYYNSILRFNGTTGAFIDLFVPSGSAGLTLAPTAGVIFGPDVNGDGAPDLYVSNGVINEVLIYNGVNGSFLKKYITPGLGGLYNPKGLLFDRDGNLLVVDGADNVTSSVRRFGLDSLAAFTVSLSEPSATPVTIDFTTADGTATAGTNYTAVSGTLTFAPGVTTRTVLVRTVNNILAQGNTTFSLNLSNPAGVMITRGQGVATVTDDDSTKFFVADDGATDRTYRYGLPGNALGISNLVVSNAAPRGIATSAAGDKVWVVDANKTVYVYNPSGGLLGSWSAGGLTGNAAVEGIATNGADVWLLDGGGDKVYKYTGAAGRLSGSQSAAGSFKLTNADSNAKGIVTDGTSFWVVDDGSSSDKVFKYTLSGSLLGSWTIDPANAHPTGLTINPASVSNIWVVDNGTDRVYQYTAATGRTSGSQVAGATFALAAGNTNPQDIADPPPPGAMISFTATSADEDSISTWAPALISQFPSARRHDWAWLLTDAQDSLTADAGIRPDPAPAHFAVQSAIAKSRPVNELIPLAAANGSVPSPIEVQRGTSRDAGSSDGAWNWLDIWWAAREDDLVNRHVSLKRNVLQ